MARRPSAGLAAQARGAPPNDLIAIAVLDVVHVTGAEARGAPPNDLIEISVPDAEHLAPAQPLVVQSAPRDDAASPHGPVLAHGVHQMIVVLLLVAC